MVKRAVLAGLNYPGTENALRGSINDLAILRGMLVKTYEFPTENITVLVDDELDAGTYDKPTAKNILKSLRSAIKETKDGDILFFSYGGHGSQMEDQDGDEADGYDEFLIASDLYPITDDMLKVEVAKLPEGAKFIMVADCCSSGTLLDQKQLLSGKAEQNEGDQEVVGAVIKQEAKEAEGAEGEKGVGKVGKKVKSRGWGDDDEGDDEGWGGEEEEEEEEEQEEEEEGSEAESEAESAASDRESAEEEAASEAEDAASERASDEEDAASERASDAEDAASERESDDEERRSEKLSEGGEYEGDGRRHGEEGYYQEGYDQEGAYGHEGGYGHHGGEGYYEEEHYGGHGGGHKEKKKHHGLMGFVAGAATGAILTKVMGGKDEKKEKKEGEEKKEKKEGEEKEKKEGEEKKEGKQIGLDLGIPFSMKLGGMEFNLGKKKKEGDLKKSLHFTQYLASVKATYGSLAAFLKQQPLDEDEEEAAYDVEEDTGDASLWVKQAVGKAGKKTVGIKAKHCVLISGCMDEESAADADLGGLPHGPLTYGLVNVVAKSGSWPTYREVMSSVRGLVSQWGYDQNPGLSCSDDVADDFFICNPEEEAASKKGEE